MDTRRLVVAMLAGLLAAASGSTPDRAQTHKFCPPGMHVVCSTPGNPATCKCVADELVLLHGNVVGLSGKGLTLVNSGFSTGVSANGPVTIDARAYEVYSIEINSDPTGPLQACYVENGYGTATASGSSQPFTVYCGTPYTVGGTITGLLSGSSGLYLNLSSLSIYDTEIKKQNGPFTFSLPLVHNSWYQVTVFDNPNFENCDIANGSGTIGVSNVTNVLVTCAIAPSASQWTPIGYPGGRIDVAAPGGTNVMYVGANVGGIWKTTDWLDATPVWTALTDLPQVLSLAVHEHDLVVFPGNTNIVLGAASGPGGGVLRSDDSGATWSYLANSHFDLAEFGAIVVDPNVANAQTMYVAISAGKTDFISGSGLYKSNDGGATWSDAGSGTFKGFVSDLLEIQENGATVLYAADTAGGLANSGGIYRSDNFGTTWTKTNLPTNANGFFSFRLAGSTTPTEKIYVAAIDNSDPKYLHGVITRYVTSDQGSHWTPLTWPDAPGSAQWHRYRHNLIAVDPANSSTVYVNVDGENNLNTNSNASCNSPNSSCNETIWQSTDGGQNWNFISGGGGGPGDPVSATFDSQGAFVETGDTDVYHTNHLDSKIGNLIAPEFYSFSLDPSNPRTAYGVVQDGPGTLKYSGSLAWQYRQPRDAGQGESGKIRVDPTNPNRIYYLDPGPTGCPQNSTDCVTHATSAARFVHSDDTGNTWKPAITGLTTIMYQGNTITDWSSTPGKGTIVIDPNNPQRLLIAVHKSIFETQTGGDPNPALPFGGNGWRDIGSTLPLNGGWICKIALAPSDSNTIFVGTEDGRVFKTTNAGNDCNPNCPTWTEVDSRLPQNGRRIMDLQIDPTNPDHDFAVTSPFMGRDDNAPDFSGFDHVWVRNCTSDCPGPGGAWSSINGDLPTELGGETITVDWSSMTPKLYVGTLRGMFGSTDLGSTWARFESVPRTRVTDFDFVPSLNLIGAGTLGRGAFEILTH